MGQVPRRRRACKACRARKVLQDNSRCRDKRRRECKGCRLRKAGHRPQRFRVNPCAVKPVHKVGPDRARSLGCNRSSRVRKVAQVPQRRRECKVCRARRVVRDNNRCQDKQHRACKVCRVHKAVRKPQRLRVNRCAVRRVYNKARPAKARSLGCSSRKVARKVRRALRHSRCRAGRKHKALPERVRSLGCSRRKVARKVRQVLRHNRCKVGRKAAHKLRPWPGSPCVVRRVRKALPAKVRSLGCSSRKVARRARQVRRHSPCSPGCKQVQERRLSRRCRVRSRRRDKGRSHSLMDPRRAAVRPGNP